MITSSLLSVGMKDIFAIEFISVAVGAILLSQAMILVMHRTAELAWILVTTPIFAAALIFALAHHSADANIPFAESPWIFLTLIFIMQQWLPRFAVGRKKFKDFSHYVAIGILLLITLLLSLTSKLQLVVQLWTLIVMGISVVLYSKWLRLRKIYNPQIRISAFVFIFTLGCILLFPLISSIHPSGASYIIKLFHALCFGSWWWYIVVLTYSLVRSAVSREMEIKIRNFNPESIQKRAGTDFTSTEAHDMLSRQTEFLATMSHEMRTPLAGIVGFSRMLATALKKDDPLAKDMGTIERLAVQLLKTVDQGLAYVSTRDVDLPNQICTVDVRHLVRDIKALARWLAQQHNNTFEFFPGEKIPAQLVFNEQAMRQILINLVSNAARYCNDGTISLAVMFLSRGKTHQLVWVIEDTGRGMDDIERTQFFMPFVKSRDSQGLGLGLPLVKRLVAEMAGNLDMITEKGRGTKFRISIPVILHERDTQEVQFESADWNTHPMGPESVPMILLSAHELHALDIGALRRHIKFGQFSEIEAWISRAKSLTGLSAEAGILINKLAILSERIDLETMSELIDDFDSPASFV